MSVPVTNFVFPEYGIFGSALETNGLTVRGAICPVSLLLFGLMWECDFLWSTVYGVSLTTWSATASATLTTWTAQAGGVTLTTWKTVNNGDC